MTVNSVFDPVDHGDRIDDLFADNPDLAREALEAAVTLRRLLRSRPITRLAV
jgi:uncharacterized protein (DUF433 family)